MYYWNHRGMNGWGWFVASISAILFWMLLILLIVFLVRTMNRGSGRPHNTPGRLPPERVLAERFARGEIDEEEYRRRLAVLREEHHGPDKRERAP
ncbi:SHOCT domain-containing protein [Streptomyces sp. NPDC057062]|uniref:SHOCT domain-containing protein n=1 Tax=Streptomyces sp. NPDC057062 TaxID=3346011 RepID=UPI0036343E8D